MKPLDLKKWEARFDSQADYYFSEDTCANANNGNPNWGGDRILGYSLRNNFLSMFRDYTRALYQDVATVIDPEFPEEGAGTTDVAYASVYQEEDTAPDWQRIGIDFGAPDAIPMATLIGCFGIYQMPSEPGNFLLIQINPRSLSSTDNIVITFPDRETLLTQTKSFLMDFIRALYDILKGFAGSDESIAIDDLVKRLGDHERDVRSVQLEKEASIVRQALASIKSIQGNRLKFDEEFQTVFQALPPGWKVLGSGPAGALFRIKVPEYRMPYLGLDAVPTDKPWQGARIGPLILSVLGHLPRRREINNNTRVSFDFRVTAGKNAAKCGDGIHPHIGSGGAMCWGERSDIISRASQGELREFLISLPGYLTSYHHPGAYHKINGWWTSDRQNYCTKKGRINDCKGELHEGFDQMRCWFCGECKSRCNHCGCTLVQEEHPSCRVCKLPKCEHRLECFYAHSLKHDEEIDCRKICKVCFCCQGHCEENFSKKGQPDRHEFLIERRTA